MKRFSKAQIVLILACFMSVALAACPPAKIVDPKFSEVASFHKSKCAACHVRVEPGERTRTQLERIVPAHRKRVSLTDAQWSLLIDYLADDHDH